MLSEIGWFSFLDYKFKEFFVAIAKQVKVTGIYLTTSDITTSKRMDLR